MKTKELCCEDLMVGDWVRCTDPKPFRITDIETEWGTPYFCVTGTECLAVDGGDLQPIPLTKEILEKNGFKLHAISEIYELVSPKKDWFVAIGFKDGCIDWCKVRRWGDEYLGSIKYVHKLQHALKLFGIDKTIKL